MLIPSHRLAARALTLSLLALGPTFLMTSTVQAQPPGAVQDNFDRPTSGTLGVATSGHQWTTHVGQVGVDGGLAVPGTGFYLSSIDAALAALDVEVTLVQPADEFWLILRFENASNYWRFGRWQGQAYTLQQVVNNGLGAPPLQTFATVAPQAGDRLSCKLRPSLIECRVNGSIVVTASSPAGSTATAAGLSGYLGSATRYDDFSAVAPSASDLVVSMTGPTVVDMGTQANWNVTVANVGAADALSATVLVTPPSAVTNLTFPGTACGPEGNSWRCALGNVTVGQTHSIEIQATTPDLLTSLTFTALASSASPDQDPADNQASITAVTREPAPAGALVFDDFNRPNGPVGTAFTGQPWTLHYGALAVAGDAAAPGEGFVLASVSGGIGRGTLDVRATGVDSEFWLVFRLSDGSNYFRFGRWRNEPYQLQKISANAATIYLPLLSVAPVAGDTLRCAYSGNQIDCLVNNVLVARATDAFNSTAAGVGVSAYQSSAARFDDLVLTDPPRADAVVQIAGSPMLRTGELGSWAVSLQNSGTGSITSAQLLVTPPQQLLGAAITGASCPLQSGVFVCAIGSIAPGATATVTLNGAASEPTSLTVSASTPVLPGETATADNAASFTTPVRASVPSNATVVDLFDRPNSPSLGTADTGQPWTNHAGSPGIQGNESALTAGFTLASLNAGVANGDVTATVAALANEFWLVLRLSDGQNYWRFGRSAGGAYQLQQIAGNQIAAPQIQLLSTVQPAAHDRLACRLSSRGVECAVNDVPVVRTTDTFNHDATRVGISGYNADTARFDEFVMVHGPEGPDLTVMVSAPVLAMTDQAHSVRVTVRNDGDAPALPSTLTINPPPAATVLAVPPSCTVSAGELTCALGPALAVAGAEQFTLTLSSAHETLSGTAQASSAGDAYPGNNAAAWTTTVYDVGSGVFDSFSRPDSPSSLGSTLSGESWETLSGTFGVVNGEAVGAAAGSLARVTAGSAFGTLEVVLGDNPSAAGIAFRIVDANNYYRLVADQDGLYRIAKVVNGVETSVQYYILRIPTQASAGDHVRIVTRPDDGMFVAVNGRHIIDAGDQQFMHATGWGLATLDASASFRSFALRYVIEGFQAYDAFDGNNGTPLLTPTSGVNYHWLTWSGPPFVYSNGTAVLSMDAYSVATLDTSSERATTKVRIVHPGSGGWIVFRFVESGETYRFGHEGGAAYAVSYVLNYTALPLPVPVQTLATRIPAAGDLLEVRQAADGTVECYVNGTMTHRFVDPGGVGFRSTLTGLASYGAAETFDDFEAIPLPH